MATAESCTSERTDAEQARPEQLQRMAAGLDRLMMWARRQAPPQLSSSSIATLDTLLYRGPLRISDLAAAERISQPGMTTLINRLEAGGLAERVADRTDGRATLVRITADGRRLVSERHASRAGALERHIAALPIEHQRALIGALAAIDGLVGGIGAAAQKEDPHV